MFGRLFPSAHHPHCRHGTLRDAGRVYVLLRNDGRVVKQVHHGKFYLVHFCACGAKACHYCAACGREQRAGEGIAGYAPIVVPAGVSVPGK